MTQSLRLDRRAFLRGAGTALALPLVLIPQVMFTLGLCWFLSALGVFLRDTSQVMGLLLTAVAVEMLLRGIEAFVRQLRT